MRRVVGPPEVFLFRLPVTLWRLPCPSDIDADEPSASMCPIVLSHRSKDRLLCAPLYPFCSSCSLRSSSPEALLTLLLSVVRDHLLPFTLPADRSTFSYDLPANPGGFPCGLRFSEVVLPERSSPDV